MTFALPTILMLKQMHGGGEDKTRDPFILRRHNMATFVHSLCLQDEKEDAGRMSGS